ncbi:hypothetical protein CONCODRAFT_80521 [Conidiobolus coronatus NRRL 28638]|uniref:G-protein coupled receptors family 1 profile domain-containing protein n=1 Tax=Conidiobolus coronatus (strain ATCC 28846 / CBS 209.66 / NRRL 28638) TaxID=796925 RepID=A0A137NU77_CONC2|nr:hypothetical protein CONCODRAFT_80521 [Conidiobolus coronatus NRRL 28638]|eukprot:KXN66330.1 hypothetical protein CONCODRAFT_80521 [Conidiobolus coronatus NRRL 28638]
MILVCYISITITVYKTFSKLNPKSDTLSESFSSGIPYTTYQRRIIYKLVVLILLYMICFVPGLAFTTFTTITAKRRDAVMDSISGIAFALALFVNAIFVLIYQREARDILLSMLPRWLYSSKSDFEPIGLRNIQI